jgi:hypothetical protein
MPITKFNEKNIALFSKVETVSGTYGSPSATTDATPITSLDGGFTFDTAAFQFLGDALSRDEFTYQKDIYGELNAEIMQPTLGIVPAATVYTAASANVTAGDLMLACGGNFAQVGTTITAGISFDNYTATSATVSIDYRKSTTDAVNQNLYPFFNVNGMVDLSASVGEIPKLKFSLKGNVGSATSSAPVLPNYGDQTTNIAPVIKMSSITSAKLVEIPDSSTFIAGPAVTTLAASTTEPNTWIATTATGNVAALGAIGNLRPMKLAGITGATALNGVVVIAEVVSETSFKFYQPAIGTPAGTITSTKAPLTALCENLSFSTLTASNFFGFDFARYLTGAEEGFAKTAVPTDVAITVLEAPVGDTTYFVPDQTEVSKFYAVKLHFGTVAGKKVVYLWDKLQMSNIKEGKVSTYFGRDITFRNTGKSAMILL